MRRNAAYCSLNRRLYHSSNRRFIVRLTAVYAIIIHRFREECKKNLTFLLQPERRCASFGRFQQFFCSLIEAERFDCDTEENFSNFFSKKGIPIARYLCFRNNRYVTDGVLGFVEKSGKMFRCSPVQNPVRSVENHDFSTLSTAFSTEAFCPKKCNCFPQ